MKGASDIAHRYGSGFGIWLGPRGGYNFNQQWGKFLEQHGNGTYSTTTYDVVTGDSVYVAKLRDFFIKQQRDYGVNYWKLDGFATQQPQASTNGRYITGGKTAIITLPNTGNAGTATSMPCMPMPRAATRTCGLT